MQAARRLNPEDGPNPFQKPLPTPQPTPKPRNSAGWLLYRACLFALAWGLLALYARQTVLGSALVVQTLLAAIWMGGVLSLKFLKKEMNTVWLTVPLLFTFALWLPRPVAPVLALVGYFLLSRSGKRREAVRAQARLQGAMLALSLIAGRFAFDQIFLRSKGMPHTTARLFDTPSMPLEFLWRLCLGSVAGLVVLAAVYTLLETISNRLHPASLSEFKPECVSLERLAFGIALCLLFTPLGMLLGAGTAIPLGALLIFGAIAFQTQQSAHQLQNSLRVAQAVGKIALTQTAEDDAVSLSQRFLNLMGNLLPSETAQIWMMDIETDILTPRASLTRHGFQAQATANYGEGIIGQAAMISEPRRIPEAALDSHKAKGEAAAGAWLLYPIRAKGELLAIAQWIRPAEFPFTQDDILKIESLLPSYAVALENIHIRETMHLLASTDGLTGLWNHRRIQEILRDELRRSARYHHPLSVLMFDVDSFKSFNDTYGHPQGDRLLKRVAEVLEESVRNVDFVGRYGGEEFVIVLPETAKEDACMLAERIRHSIEFNAVVEIGEMPVSRTVSVGVASYPEDGLSVQDIVQIADEALYTAKRSGKNRVIWSEPRAL